MKNIIMVLIWFLVLSFAFAFIGGLINGLSGSEMINQTLTISLLVLLAFAVSIIGVYKQLLPGTK